MSWAPELSVEEQSQAVNIREKEPAVANSCEHWLFLLKLVVAQTTVTCLQTLILGLEEGCANFLRF